MRCITSHHFIGKSTLFYQCRCSSVTMHFYAGVPCSVYFIKAPLPSNNTGGGSGSGPVNLRRIKLGANGSEGGETSQIVIPKGTWFTRILESCDPEPKPEEEAVREEEFSLIGVSYCPGFNYADVKTATFDVIASCYKRNSPRIEGN